MSGSRLAAVVAVAGVVAGIPAAAQKKHAASYAIVAGTVFRDPGLALAGAKVVLMIKADSKTKKIQEAETNYRGEFSFRVPAGEAKYVLRASMKGYGPDEKEAAVSGEENIDVNLVLTPVAK